MGITPEQARRELARRKALKDAQQAPVAEAPPAPEPAAEEPSAFERFGRAHIDAGKALLTGAGVGAAMGKDDDLAGAAAALGAATQKDLDEDKPMSALRRVLGTAAPILAPGLGLSGLAISKYEQMRSDEAAPGARESAALGQRAKVAKSFEESPVLTGAGMLAGGALTGGASAAAPRTAYRIAPTMAQRAAVAFPSGFVTGYEGNDDGNLQERIASGLGGGVLSSGIAGAAPAVLGAAGRGLDRLGNMTLRPKHVSPTAWQQFDKAIAAYDDPGLLAGAAKAGARAKTSGLSDLAVKSAKVLRRKLGPTPKARAKIDDVAGYVAKPSKVDDALMQKMTGGADLVDDLAASADDVASDDAALAALKAKMAAEEAPIVLRKKINPVGPEDIIDDVAPSAAPPAEVTPPRPMTPAEMEAAISRLPSRGQAPRPSALDDELEAVGAGLREGTPVPLEGADVDPIVPPPAREATAVQRGRTPRPAPMPEVMPDDFVDEGVSVLRQIPGRRPAPQLEAGPETLQLEGRGDVPALPARPAQRQLEAPAPVLRQRKLRLTDDEAAAKIRAMALEHGTLDTATLSAKSGLSSSQVSRVLPRISRSAAFRNEVAAVGGRAVDPPPPSAPLADTPDAPISMPTNQLEDWGTRPAAPSSPQANAARNQGFIPPDLLDAQIARTKDARRAVAASHGQLAKQFKNMEPEKAVGRQRSAVEFDPNSPGPAPIATPKGRNRSDAPFQGEDWAPREAAAPAAVVDDVAAPVGAADEQAAFRAAYALSDAAERAGTKASISGTSGDHVAAAKAHEAAAAALGPGGAGQKHLRAAAEHRAQASTAPSSKATGFDVAGRPILRKKATR